MNSFGILGVSVVADGFQKTLYDVATHPGMQVFLLRQAARASGVLAGQAEYAGRCLRRQEQVLHRQADQVAIPPNPLSIRPQVESSLFSAIRNCWRE